MTEAHDGGPRGAPLLHGGAVYTTDARSRAAMRPLFAETLDRA